MEYLFVLESTGERVTSLVVGIHADSMEELKQAAAVEYPGCTLLEGGDEEQNLFMQGMAWDGEKFFKPDPPEPDLDQMKARKLAEVDEWTASHIVGGFDFNGVRYDSDLPTQLTMQGIALQVDTDRFEQEYPNGCPVRGYDSGSDKKTVHWLSSEEVKGFCANMSAHIGECKRQGWRLQKAVEKATTLDELDTIKWVEDNTDEKVSD